MVKVGDEVVAFLQTENERYSGIVTDAREYYYIGYHRYLELDHKYWVYDSDIIK